MIHPSRLPSLVFADKTGNITEFEPLAMAGMSNRSFRAPLLEELIPLPAGSELFHLPQRVPVGIDPQTGEPLLVEENPFGAEEGIQAVAAFIAPAHTAILTSAYQRQSDKPPILPLFAYSAVGWYGGQFWVAAFRSDRDIRQDANQFDQRRIQQKTQRLLLAHQSNRLIQHLGKCCLTYCCPAARNFFLGRWEAPLPTSPQCNARCLGCISLQPSGCCPATQERINFVPSVGEISEIAVPHLNTAERPIVSFGQGCEGEPLLQVDVIDRAIRNIRKSTSRGTINLNTNASLPDRIETLAKAGLDSMRVSLNSAQERYYTPYYKPTNYSFSQVLDSISVMKKAGRFVSLNYFVIPGLTDTEKELESLCHILESYSPDLIQLRNLNMDPEVYFQSIGFTEQGPAIGILQWKKMVKARFPSLRFGYYNPEVT